VSIIIRENGLTGSWEKIKHQFVLCEEAHKKIRHGRKTGSKSKKKNASLKLNGVMLIHVRG